LWRPALMPVPKLLPFQSTASVVAAGGDQRVLRGEVPVEGLVGQAGCGDDVSHAGAGGGALPAHDLERGVE